MVTDVILSGLINLFALFGARNNVDRKGSHSILKSYLSRHLGVQHVGDFIGMYDDLRDLYDVMPEINKSQVIRDVNDGLKGKIDRNEREMMLLRLMQFCAGFGSKDFGDKRLFSQMAETFGISEERYSIFRDFVFDGISSSVHHKVFDGLDGHLTTLWLEDSNRLLFTYHGNSTVMMDDIPVIRDTFQTWSRSSVLKVQHSGLRLYFSNITTPFPASPIEGEGPRFARRLARCGSQEMAKLAKQGSSPSMGEAGEGGVVFAGSLDFHFPGSDDGIHDFSFRIRGCELVAVMGGSGTGKSTLMSLLNGMLTPQSGAVTLNGHGITEPCVKSLVGFVPQDDLLVEELTVYQNLWYTAKLWFGEMGHDEIHRRVIAVLQQLGLEQTKDLRVGSPLQKTISGGQRKRLNIALELIRDPQVLFIDEPTSGLSSSDSEKVINILKEQTYKGRLIIINIHQPSSDVYKLFDRLWILDKGGYPVYDGNPIEAITYFKAAAGYADAEISTCRTCGNVNPEIILNIIEEKALDESGEISSQRKVSPKQWHQLYKQSITIAADDATDTPEVQGAVRKGQGKQHKRGGVFLTYLRRNISTKKANLQYILITLLAAPVLAVICSWLTHYSPSEGYSVMDNKNMVSYLFMSVIVATFLGMSGSAEEIIRDRVLLRRERFLSLPYLSYKASKIAFMMGVVAIQTLLFVIVGNGIQKLSLFMTWWGILFVTAFVAGLTGLYLSKVMKSVVAIYITIPLLLIPQILLCGLVVNFQDLTPGSSTGNVPLIGNMIPSRWAYEALAVEQFKSNSYEAPLFAVHKEKYESQYYNMVFLDEVQTQLETMHYEEQNGGPVDAAHQDVIKKALPTLANVSGIPSYSGDYTYSSIKGYTDRVGKVLSQRSNRATLTEDSIVRTLETHKKLIDIKRANYNKQLENICVNADAKHTHDIVDGYIVPRVGFVYLTPVTHYGNAPFYSAEKVIASWHIPTLWFNMGVLLFMALMLIVML